MGGGYPPVTILRGEGDDPLLLRHMGGGYPPVKKKEGRGVGITPLPLLSGQTRLLRDQIRNVSGMRAGPSPDLEEGTLYWGIVYLLFQLQKNQRVLSRMTCCDPSEKRAMPRTRSFPESGAASIAFAPTERMPPLDG